MEPLSQDRPAAARLQDTVRDARAVLEIEIDGLRAVQARLDERFTRAVDLLFACSGRIVVTGLGKSGIVAKKIASTLTSTGTPSLYLHPVEAAHGDMGIQSDFLRHDAGEPCDFGRMRQYVLAVARSEFQPAHQPQNLGMQVVEPEFEGDFRTLGRQRRGVQVLGLSREKFLYRLAGVVLGGL